MLFGTISSTNNSIFPIFHVNYLIILFDEFKTIKLDLDLG